MPHRAWSLVRTMALVFAGLCLVQLALSFMLLGLEPGQGSYAILIVQLGLVLAFAALAVYANANRRQAERARLRERGGRHA